MQTTISFMLLALITVTTSTIQNHSFISSGEAVGLKFADEHVTAGVRSRLHCAALCDQHTWCIALSWDKSTEKCQEFKRTLTPEVTPHLIVTTDKGHGYSYMAGMIIKFTTTFGKMSWISAQNKCVQEDGRLVVLDTKEKYQAIKAAMKKDLFLYENIWFVGATEIDGTWKLTTGQALDPSISVQIDEGTKCLAYYQAKLHDNWCDYNTTFICEK